MAVLMVQKSIGRRPLLCPDSAWLQLVKSQYLTLSSASLTLLHTMQAQTYLQQHPDIFQGLKVQTTEIEGRSPKTYGGTTFVPLV